MKQQVKDLLKYLKSLNLEIEDSLINNRLEEAKAKINEYKTYLNDAELYTLKATYHFQKGEYKDTISTLLEGIQKHPFNFEIFLNLGLIYEETKDAMASLKYYAYAAKYSRNKEENEESNTNFKRVIEQLHASPNVNKEKLNEIVVECNKLLQEVDARLFPLDQNGNSLIRKVMHKGTTEEFMVNMYKSYVVGNINKDTRLYFKSELFKGKENDREMELQLNSPSIVPISLIEPSTEVEFFINNKKYSFLEKDLVHNRFHYLKFNEPGKLKIVANKPIFVGNPIELADKIKTPKLVFKIFIDGLSYKFLEKKGLEKVMPNTYAFFKEGFISNNSYATSEWTLPSKASINTGKYPTNHKLLHPEFPFNFEKYNKMMAEYLSEAGYFTTNICTNWRTTPTFGYYKGFDRILFQNFFGGMDCRDVIMEAIEHLESFSEKNQYLSISLMDLHNVPDEIENNLYAQMNTDICYRLDTRNKGETSVLTKYDENKIIKYYEEIKRVDVFLGILFDFINKKYKNEEILIVMHSDHGQTFLEKENSISHESRRKIPLMIKGNGVPSLMSDETIESIDILPIILKQCGIEIPNTIDGKLPKCFGGEHERKFAITHVIHPNQTYKAAISDELHIFQFETKENVENDLTVNLESYTVKLLNKNNNINEAELYEEKVMYYEKIVFEHIKDFIRWNKPVK